MPLHGKVQVKAKRLPPVAVTGCYALQIVTHCQPLNRCLRVRIRNEM
jgi:hypothetical protein